MEPSNDQAETLPPEVKPEAKREGKPERETRSEERNETGRNEARHEPRVIDPRRRLRELLAVPERDRSDAQWDEINELEIQLAPGNRVSGAPLAGGASSGGQAKKFRGKPRAPTSTGERRSPRPPKKPAPPAQ